MAKLDLEKQFLQILARKYRLKYMPENIKCGPKSSEINIHTVKINNIQLQNGDKRPQKAENVILTSSLKNKLDIFEMFHVNMESLEKQLSQLFQPLAQLIQLIDRQFDRKMKNETSSDFMLKLLLRLTEIFGSKGDLQINGGSLIRPRY